MRKFGVLILAVAMTAFSGAAFARGGGGGSGSGVLFDVNLYYTTHKSESQNTGGATSTDYDSKLALYDIKLGMLTGSGLYFGGLYTSRSDSAMDASGGGGSALGGSLGYFGASGFFLMGHYIFSASEGNLTQGTGVQADFGYKAGMGSGWLLGAEMSYRSISYKKDSANASLDHRTKTDLVPMVSVGYMF